MSEITVQNPSGQVTSLSYDGPFDPVKTTIDGLIKKGELTKVASGTKSTRPGTPVVVDDSDAGLADERGDLLKSIHGGGLDPDAKGDALGQPSGSEATGKAASNPTEAAKAAKAAASS